MPQLSSAALVGCAVSLTAARLFALLADGNVHVWQLHLRRPPSFVVGRGGSDGAVQKGCDCWGESTCGSCTLGGRPPSW